MKKAVLIFLSSFLFACGNLFSQAVKTPVPKKVVAVKKWALQFEVGYNFDIRSFQNLAFSLKYSFNPVTSIRFGPGYSFEIEDKENTTINEQVINIENKSYDLSFTTEFLFNVNPKSDLKVYLGAGPTIKYSFSHSESFNELLEKRIIESEGLGGGLSLVIGGEWYVSNLISLIAEYNTTAFYENLESQSYTESPENFIQDKTNLTSKEWSVKPKDAILGISLHF